MVEPTNSPRTDIGLDRAAEGDLEGLRRFISFTANEFRTLSLTKFHPDIAARLSGIKRDAEELTAFLDGWLARAALGEVLRRG